MANISITFELSDESYEDHIKTIQRYLKNNDLPAKKKIAKNIFRHLLAKDGESFIMQPMYDENEVVGIYDCINHK